MANDNRCVCCGEIIPEGMIACPTCPEKHHIHEVTKKIRLIDANDPISEGDVLYIIAKFNLVPWENPCVVEVSVAYKKHKRFYSYNNNGVGTFSFNQRDLGRCVFRSREEAEAKLAELLITLHKANFGGA